MRAALFATLTALLAACGYSSRTVSIIGPPQPELTAITVAPAAASLAIGLTQQYSATGVFSDGSRQDLSSTVTWSSSSSSVASISNAAGSNGLATALTVGSTTITAAAGSIFGTTTLTVTPVALVSIAVTPPAASIAYNGTQLFTATGTYSDRTTQVITTAVIWASSTPTIATIDTVAGSNNLATAVTPGTTTITATQGGVTGATTLTVNPPPLLFITVTPANARIRIGGTQQYTATGTYADGSTKDITTAVVWNSSVPATATIAATGIATGVAIGTTLISATLGTITSISVTLTVTAFAYALNFDRNNPTASTVSQYTIGVNGGLTALTPVPTAPTEAGPFSVVADPTGKYVYVGNYHSNSVSQYTVQPDGSLLPMAPPTVATGLGPNGIAVSPTGPYVYVANYGDGGSADGGTVSQFNIGPNGNLTPMTPPTVPVGPVPPSTFPASVAVNPAGTFAYVVDYAQGGTSGAVYGFSVNTATGALTPLAVQVAAAGSNPNFVAIHPSGKFAYVANSGQGAGGNSVSQYAIGADGSLTALNPPTVAAGTGTGQGPWSITIDAAGKNAYVPNHDDGNVYHFTIAADGTLTTVGGVLAGAGPTSLAIDPSGRYAYVTDRGSPTPSTISQFSVNPTDGTLTPLAAAPTVPAGTEPVAIITVR